MRLSPAEPNLNAAVDSQLFLLLGDATAGPIHKIEFAPGVAHPQTPTTTSNFNLRIFHFNDLHGHLMRFTRQQEEAILPRLAGKIKSTRRAYQAKPNAAVLVFSAGDDCTGSVFDEILTDSRKNQPLHPGYQLYSKMGVDAAGLGNHDLDRGPQFLAESIQNNARFPVLAANLKNCAPLAGVCHPAALLVVGGLRIGLIGLVTRAETQLDPATCQIVDPIPVAQNLIPALRPLCDVLIILSHLGYCLSSPVPMADAGEVELAQSLPPGSVDLIIGGHSHTALNRNGLEPQNIVNGIPIVQSGARGEFLGQIDLKIDPQGARVTASRLIPTASLPSDPVFEAEMQPLNQRARQIWHQPVGLVEDFPDFNPLTVLTDFARREMALANFVADALVARMRGRGFKVDFAMIDASALQYGFPLTRQLTYGDCFEVMPFADTLRLYTLTGHQMQDLLNDNALRLDRPGAPDLERGFLQFSREVRYTLDPGTAQISAVTIHDTPLAERLDETFTVVTTSFIRRLAEPWVAHQTTGQCSLPAETPADIPICPTQLFDIQQFAFVETDLLLRNEIVAYIRACGGVSRQTGARCDGRLEIKD